MKRRALWLLLAVLLLVLAASPVAAQTATPTPTWECAFDFTVSDYSAKWSLLVANGFTYGSWVAGSGYKSRHFETPPDPGNYVAQEDLVLNWTIGGGTTLTQLYWSQSTSALLAANGYVWRYSGVNNNAWTNGSDFTSGTMSGTGITNYSWFGSQAMNAIAILLEQDTGTTSLYLRSITMRGTGSPPCTQPTATLTPSPSLTPSVTPTASLTPTGTIQAGFLPTLDQRPRCTSTPAPSETARPGGILALNNRDNGFSVFEGVSPEDTLTPVYLGTKVGYVAARSPGDCASDTAVGAAGSRKFDVGFDAVCGEDLGGGVGFGNDAEPPVIPVGCTKKRDCYTVIPAIDLAPVGTALPAGISSSQTRFTIEETKICVMYRRISLTVAGVDLTSLVTLLLGALSVFSIVNTIRWSP